MDNPAVHHRRSVRWSPSRLQAIRTCMQCLATFAAMIALPHSSRAQATVGFRSGFTEGNGIAPRGNVDVDYGTSATAVGSTRSYAVGEVTAHVPLSARFGMRVHLNSYTWIRTPASRVAGHEQIGVGTAFVITGNAGWRPSTALLTRLDVPSGSIPTTGRVWRPTVKAALSWKLPAGLTLASNIGIASLSESGGRYTQRFGSLWLGRRITGRAGAFAEAFAFDRESSSGVSTQYARGGMTVLVGHGVHLDLNAATQLTNGTARRTVGIGVKHRI